MKTFFNLTTPKDAAAPAELFIFDTIGDLGTDAGEFMAQMATVKDRDLVVKINSPGGDVFAGLAIANALRAHPKHVKTVVVGLAASIASVILLAGKEVVAAENSMIMIHDPASVASGKAGDLRQSADVLDQVRDNLAGIYVAKTGKTISDIRSAMSAETWFSAAEAKAYGLVDSIEAAVNVTNRFDLGAFKNLPSNLLRDQIQNLTARLDAERRIRISAIVDTAVSETRILAAHRDIWIARLMTDESTRAELDGLLPACRPNPLGPDIYINERLEALVQHKARLAKLKTV